MCEKIWLQPNHNLLDISSDERIGIKEELTWQQHAGHPSRWVVEQLPGEAPQCLLQEELLLMSLHLINQSVWVNLQLWNQLFHAEYTEQ